MYKSPIEMIMGQIRTQQEDHAFKAVQEVGIIVDKEELLKALKYDRDQYDRGYHDALVARSMLAEDIKEGVAREIFEEVEKSVHSKIPKQIHPIFKNDRDFGDGFRDGKTDALIEVLVLISELKKKYTEGK